MRAYFGCVTILLLWLGRATLAVKSVDVISGSLATGIQEEEILRVLAQNKTGNSENFTFVELIGSMAHRYNDSLAAQEIRSYPANNRRTTNPYYGEFGAMIKCTFPPPLFGSTITF
jgi:hypothetical protein